jgi:aspartyl-tRNA(Asn)/glutamyl-tRNA(Gln) amidotransferase subunit A
VFRSLGTEIVPVRVPTSIALAASENAFIVQFEAAKLHTEWLKERSHDYGPHTVAMLRPGLTAAASHYIEASTLRAKLLFEFTTAVFEKADVFHSPVMLNPVPTIANTTFDDDASFMEFWRVLSHCTRPFNYLGLPALSLPAGFDCRGLPVGFQLVGRPFDKRLLFRVGHAYERETSWSQVAPPL